MRARARAPQAARLPGTRSRPPCHLSVTRHSAARPSLPRCACARCAPPAIDVPPRHGTACRCDAARCMHCRDARCAICVCVCRVRVCVLRSRCPRARADATAAPPRHAYAYAATPHAAQLNPHPLLGSRVESPPPPVVVARMASRAGAPVLQQMCVGADGAAAGHWVRKATLPSGERVCRARPHAPRAGRRGHAERGLGAPATSHTAGELGVSGLPVLGARGS